MADSGKGLPYSLLASMYAAWEEYKVPAIYYHYLLSVLPNLQKKRQILLMTRQIKTLKANTHTYHRIINAIEAREKSLEIIQKNINIFTKYQNTNEMEWPQSHNLDIQGYNVIQEDSRSPILSPRKQQKTSLVQFTNHLKMYQRVTLQIIYLIAQWMDQLRQVNYDGIIQFQYQKQNYLSKLNVDTNDLLSQYSAVFQNNPFFLMKKVHEKTQFALIYANLKPDGELARKIHECLNILSNHQAQILRFRMLAKYNQKGSKKTITKSTDIHKVYMNYNNGKDYIMVQDTEIMKKSKVMLDPTRKSQNRLRKSDIIINPEPNPIVDKTQRKHPAYVNLVQNNHQTVMSEDDLLKRSATDDKLLRRKKNSLAVKPVHGKNSLFVQTDLDLTKNRGTAVQKKLQVLQQMDQETKYKSKSKKEMLNIQTDFDINSPSLKPITHHSKVQKIQKVQKVQKIQEKQQPEDQLSEDNQISLTFDENIKQTQVVKYLRSKVFHNTQMSFEQIQNIAKKLLVQKDFLTFIRVQSRGLQIAWLAVKFVQKDNTMRRSVSIVYIRKFLRLSNFERKLLDVFVSHGYGLIRNQQKILYEVQLLDIITRPLIKIKYKVNPYVDKSEIKKIMKKNKTISQTRILKYHSYSKTTKYHKYCQHEKSNCMLTFNFLELCKITIDKTHYIKGKADKITKLGSDLYKISSVINDTDMVISRTLTDILQIQKQSQIEKDSSFDSKCQTDYTHVAIKQGKLMRKYMDEQDQTIISQFITVNGNIPQVRSIAFSKEQLPESLLLFEPPFFIGIMTKEQHEAKTLSIVQFQ